MYKNLIKVMGEKNVTYKQLSEALDCEYQTVSDKIQGTTQIGFTYDEAIKIKKVFFPEYDTEYLFNRNYAA